MILALNKYRIPSNNGGIVLYQDAEISHMIFWNISDHKRNQEGDQGGLGPPRRSQICHQKVPNLTSEGPKLYLRSKNGLKKEENAWLCLHNASLEGPELFGPPKILAQLRLWYQIIYFKSQSNLFLCFDIFMSWIMHTWISALQLLQSAVNFKKWKSY